MGRSVIAYHIIFGAYGFWLPNDPRGSQSKYVFAPRLTMFGPPTRLREDTTLSPAEAERLRLMHGELQRPPVRFERPQVAAIADGFSQIIARLGLVFYAAALMPDHVHIVAARQEMYAEDIAGHLKRAGSRELRKAGVHPFAAQETRRVVAAVNPGAHAGSSIPGAHAGSDPRGRLPSPWGEHGWKVYLFDLDEIEHAVTYVNDNPTEAGLPRQKWPWVREFEG